MKFCHHFNSRSCWGGHKVKVSENGKWKFVDKKSKQLWNLICFGVRGTFESAKWPDDMSKCSLVLNVLNSFSVFTQKVFACWHKSICMFTQKYLNVHTKVFACSTSTSLFLLRPQQHHLKINFPSILIEPRIEILERREIIRRLHFQISYRTRSGYLLVWQDQWINAKSTKESCLRF